MLSTLRFENFRAWRGQHEVPLAPLTLIFGPNNCGKSAISRLPVLLSDSLEAGGLQALKLDGRLRYQQHSLRTLRWSGPQGAAGNLGIGFSRTDAIPDTVHWTINNLGDDSRTVVQQLRFGDVSMDLVHREEEVRRQTLTYTIGDTHKAVGLVRMEGLRPQGLAGEAGQALAKLALPVVWLNTARGAPARTLELTSEPRFTLAPDGQDVAAVLFGFPAVLEGVKRWLTDHLGLDIQVVEREGLRLGVELLERGNPRWRDAMDMGEGVGQLLSMLTALQMGALSEGDHARPLVVIEEPDSHLHRSLQTKLMSACAEVVHQGGQVMLETHSRTLLLSAQVLVAKGVLRPEQVQILWVSEGPRLVPVTLDKEGYPVGDWPRDALREEQELNEELMDLRFGGEDVVR